MERKNLFISNYTRIEHEVLDLSYSVDFCDEQLGVCSTAICDLIIRCGTDIESLYKEIYKKVVGGKVPKTVGEVVKTLNKRLGFTAKKLNIANAKFNFSSFNVLKPFGYESKTEDDFYHIFCCLKHDRQSSFQKATLRTLILSLGALYILNQYYLDEQQLIENTFFGEIIPTTLTKDTLVFSAYVFNESWHTIDSRLDMLRNQEEISEEDVAKLKDAIKSKNGFLPANYAAQDCLYRVETTPEYDRVVKIFSADIVNDKAAKETFLVSLLGDDKEIDTILEKYDMDVLNSILYLLTTVARRHRLRIVINS